MDNLTIPSGVYRSQEVLYRTYQAHAIDIVDITIAIIGYAVLVYFWIKVNKNKPYYEKWVNKNGRTVNVYKTLRIMMILYPIIVVVLGTLQIILTLMYK